jgi:hypothetical protein
MKMANNRPTSTRTNCGFESWICGFVSWSSNGCSLGFNFFAESMVLLVVLLIFV